MVGGHYRLSDTRAPLATDDATFGSLLRNAAVRERLYEQMFTPDGPTRYADLPPADRLAVAAGSTRVASSAMHQDAIRQLVREVPIWAEALAARPGRRTGSRTPGRTAPDRRRWRRRR